LRQTALFQGNFTPFKHLSPAGENVTRGSGESSQDSFGTNIAASFVRLTYFFKTSILERDSDG